MPTKINGTTGISRPYVHLREQYAAGVEPAGSAAGAWNVRNLNNETKDTSGVCTFTGPAFVLAAGTYQVRARAVGYQVGFTKLRLRNTTAGVTVLVGGSGYFANGTILTGDLALAGSITVAVGQTLQLQHYTSLANSLGVGVGAAGEVEVYAEIELWKDLT